MIKIRGKTDSIDINNKIIFSPRPGFVKGKGAAPEMEFPLVYGHRCPYCANVIQALFKAPRKFSLWPYEETSILSQGEKNSGEIHSTYPDVKTWFNDSCYNIAYSPAEEGSIKITLKNHIMRHAGLHERDIKGEGLWEVGKRPCMYAGIFSLREDLLIKDWLLFSGLTDSEISKCKFPEVKTMIPESDANFKLIPAVGVAPPVILVERQSLLYGYNYYTRAFLTTYKKAK